MDTEDGYVILDVRTQAEHDERRIPSAVLLPRDSITEDAACALPDTDQLILAYCRSGMNTDAIVITADKNNSLSGQSHQRQQRLLTQVQSSL